MVKLIALIGTAVCVLSAAADGWPVLKSYEGENLRRIKMPVGGIGTGQISLSGTGGLVDWEIRNSPEKGHTPCRQQVHPAFVVRTRDAKGNVSARLLEGPLDTSVYEGACGCVAPNHGYPRFRSCTFKAAYPLAQVALADPTMPVRATLEAMNPLVPGDEEASGIPAALMRWRIVNTGDEPLDVTVAAAMPNPSMGELSQEPCGENGLRGIEFRGDADVNNSSSPVSFKRGKFVVCVPEKAGTVSVATRLRLASWSDNLDQFWRRLVAHGDVGDDIGVGEGEGVGVGVGGGEGVGVGGGGGEGEEVKWCDFGLLAVRATLKPGETREFPFVLAWRFPDRSAWGRTNAEYRFGAEDFVGNHYCQVYPTAFSAAETLWRRLPELESKTLAFVNGVLAAKAPAVVKEAALFNLSTLRSETCFRTADGHFFGWEGTHDWCGSCHGSCTHVWGYEHTLVDLWPNLAKDMCNLQFREAMDDEGAIRFRIGLPLTTKARDWKLAAADGQMQCIVKAYECWKKTGDDAWLKSLYPQVKKALAFAWAKGGWDADRDGVMEGCQHNTMDVDYFGPNPQMEFLYLAALQAMERMAAFVGETSFAAECAALRAKGAEWTEKNLFNGEYYEHRVASAARDYHPTTRGGWVKFVDPEHPDFQLAGGCLVDQLVGDYAARVVGLEPVADFAHARKATETILARNRREPDAPHFNAMRDYVMAGERSLRMAWYPPDRMPKTPFPYYPETMTGFEYVVAAWLAETGDFTAAEEVVRDIRDRYDGRKRNPFDEAECGHHYSRALDSWSVLKAFASTPTVDASVPAGNIVVEKIEGDTVRLRQDLRDSDSDWFYWKFRVVGAAGRTLHFRFTGSDAVGSRGAAVSTDKGRTWRWGDDVQPSPRREEKTNDHPDWKAFDWTFGADDDEVWFSQTIPYDAADWQAFLDRHAADRGRLFETSVLCRSRKGRDVECARFGRLDGKARERVFLSSRHHCGEATATYVLEGVLEQVFADDDLGAWLRENVEFRVVPFVDKDGVVDGDQGKRRKPHDHARDYNEGGEIIYPEVRAIMEMLREWRPTVVNDFHCPWLRSSWFKPDSMNEVIYQVGLDHAANAVRQRAFGQILERVQKSGVGYRQADDYAFGRGWNTRGNYTQGKTLVDWAVGAFPDARLVTTFEIPFANARFKTLRPPEFRSFGRDVAAAYCEYLAFRK